MLLINENVSDESLDITFKNPKKSSYHKCHNFDKNHHFISKKEVHAKGLNLDDATTNINLFIFHYWYERTLYILRTISIHIYIKK